MDKLLSTRGTFYGQVLSRSPDKDLALIFENGTGEGGGIINTERTVSWLKEQGLAPRLSAALVINNNPLEQGKASAPLAVLRKEWSRVQAELSFLPNVKRAILITENVDLIKKVVMPGLESGEIERVHGTIFTLGSGVELVPTWPISNLEHRNLWQTRDVKRALKLKKPAEPLPYVTFIPNADRLYEEARDFGIVIDLETTGLDATEEGARITVLGLQWGVGEQQRARVTNDDQIAYVMGALERLAERGTHFWFHNAQFDLSFMTQRFRDEAFGRIHCTLVRARARGELIATLKHLGNYYTNRPGNYAWHVPGENFQYDNPAYVTEDLEVTWQLAKRWESFCPPVVELFEQVIVMACEQTLLGSKIDKEALATFNEELTITIEKLRGELVEEYGVEPSQTQEVVRVLQERGYKLTKKTAKGNIALDEEVLLDLGLTKLLEYRKNTKLENSFISKVTSLLRPNGRIPHRQTMLGADTGRSTMSDINWQQFGKTGPSKKLLTSEFEGGYIGNADLSAAELVVAAYVSDDQRFADSILSGDPHRKNAAKAFDIPEDQVRKTVERHNTKTTTFRVLYGGRPENDQQKRVLEYFKRDFKRLMGWIDDTRRQAMQDYCVTDAYGKTRNLVRIGDYRGKWGVGRAGINSPIQGVASHIALTITLRVWLEFKWRGLLSKVLFGVHDSIVCDIHPAEVEIVQGIFQDAFRWLNNTHMSVAFPLSARLPITGELLIGKSWAHVEEANDAYELSFPKLSLSSLE